MSRPHLLIVEDESVVAMDIQASLEAAGYETSQAVSGAEALAAAENHSPVLAIMDIGLAGEIDGIETAARMRAELDLPVIYLTGRTDGETVQRAKKTLPLGYIIKPFKPEELRSTVEIALVRREAEKRWRHSERLPRLVLEALTDGVVVTDQEGKVTFMNPTAAEISGKRAEECLGADASEVLSLSGPQRAPSLADRVRQAIREGTAASIREGLALVTGNERNQHCVEDILPLFDDSHETVGALVLLRARKAVGPAAGEARQEPGATGRSTQPCPVARPGPPESEPPEALDPATGLPGRAAAEREFRRLSRDSTDWYAAPFVLSRYELITERFGSAAADELATFYSIHLAQNLEPEDQIFRWSPSTFVVFLRRRGSRQRVLREVSRLSAVRLERIFHVHSGTALIVISAASTVLALAEFECPADLTRQVAAFIKRESYR